jgi:hypothetical protein
VCRKWRKQKEWLVFVPATLAVVFPSCLLDYNRIPGNLPVETGLVRGDEGNKDEYADKDHDCGNPHPVLPNERHKLVWRECCHLCFIEGCNRLEFIVEKCFPDNHERENYGKAAYRTDNEKPDYIACINNDNVDAAPD